MCVLNNSQVAELIVKCKLYSFRVNLCVIGSNPVLTTQREPSNEAPFFINNPMKYIKLFENFGQLPDFGTLRDFVNPENFADEDDDAAYHALLDAAVVTVETFGLDSEIEAGAKELADMGLTDRAGLIDLMPLDRVVCVYNSNGLDTDSEPSLKRLIGRFPGLFSWDEEYDDLRFADEAAQTRVDRVGEGPYDGTDIMIYQDQAGTRAVEWNAYGWSAVFMLDSSLANK